MCVSSSSEVISYIGVVSVVVVVSRLKLVGIVIVVLLMNSMCRFRVWLCCFGGVMWCSMVSIMGCIEFSVVLSMVELYIRFIVFGS